MSTKRRYSDTDKATALAYLESCRGNYQQASKHTGIPWTTIRDWEQGDGVSEDVPFLQRKSASELLETLRDKASLLAHAITPGKINEAPLTGVTIALGTVIDKIHILENHRAVTPEEMERRQQLIAEIIARHVSDPKEREAIAAEFERLGEGDSDSGKAHETQSFALGPVDSD